MELPLDACAIAFRVKTYMKLAMNDNMADRTEMHLWVVEAIIDIPVCFNLNPNGFSFIIPASFGNQDPDGFIQMRPIDLKRANSPVLWSASKPVAYECRALVRVPESQVAIERGWELFERLADRLTLLVGYPVRVITIKSAYDEDKLKECIVGRTTEYPSENGVEELHLQTQLPMNAHLGQLLNPPRSAFEAIRWFRQGMTASRKVDQYLYYYIALESIAKRVPGVTREHRRNSKGDLENDLETQENAAIRYLISHYPSLPPDTQKKLRKIRAKIVHGNPDIQTLNLASANLGLLQRLVADGIALVYGLDPASFNVLQPSIIELTVPCGDALYSPDEDPTRRWGGLLSDTFARYLEGVSASKKRNPQFSEAWLGKCLALGSQGEYDEAIKSFEEAIRLDPNNALAWNNKGIALGDQGKHDQAIEAFEKAIALNPPDAIAAIAWRNKGHSLLNLGKYNESIQANDKAIELNPKFVDAWNDKGNALIRLQKYDESIDVFKKTIQINPKFKWAWNSKGIALGNKGEYDGAIKAFEEAIRLDPKFADAWIGKGVALGIQGNLMELSRLLKKQSGRIQTMLWLGTIMVLLLATRASMIRQLRLLKRQ